MGKHFGSINATSLFSKMNHPFHNLGSKFYLSNEAPAVVAIDQFLDLSTFSAIEKAFRDSLLFVMCMLRRIKRCWIPCTWLSIVNENIHYAYYNPA